MFRGFLFDLWRVACLCGHGFKSQMCGWGGSRGFVRVTQRSAPPGLGSAAAVDGEGGGRGWVGGCSLCWSSLWPRVPSLCP